ncbi:hypothetical protein CDL12_05807 [Handroanthus impetiginosus]|uniref:Pentacotripeptide-repeat region of PRORP domain-containing protein n=1 Tax=Handroanthus impetiginosus TaxID=429701 RepID=A0A2G9HVL1_9LAMI|nr:hypothetical protein CDL12_05807 [Handroanthus impetiginosus]
MWAFRRASIRLRNRGLSSATARICCGKSEIERFCLDYNSGFNDPQEKLFDGLLSSTRFYNTSSSSLKLHREVRTFSSSLGAKSSGGEDDDLEDGFSELETPPSAPQEANDGDEIGDDLISKSDLSEDDSVADNINDELEVFGSESDAGEKKSTKSGGTSAMTEAILAAPALSVSTVMDKWVQEGNEVTEEAVILTILQLRKRRLFIKALQLSEWAESTKQLEFVNESNYASRLDLIAKVRGVHRAEEYLKQIPESLKGELVYRTLLANFVSVTNVKKSEELFNKMKDLKFPITCFSCNQLLLLYKRIDKKKIADVLLLMEKESIKPSLFTYQILIEVKGQSNDITGMEKVVETMKAEGLKPNTHIQASLARNYATAGLKDKAEAVLKELEGDGIVKNRWVFQLVLPIYASLGREDEVARIWKVCESEPRSNECIAAIEAWGQLKRIEKAEAAFNKMLKKITNPSSKHFCSLLKVYANHNMLAKGKDLVKRMAESGCNVEPLTLDAIVKLYVGAGEVEKADSILEKAVKQKRARPLFRSYLALMDKYAHRGDIHNAEKIFLMMRRAGYKSRLQQYQSLLQAYINAKAPAYGFSDRLKADNLFPNKVLASQLARVDAFRKSAASELLD